MLQTKTIVVVDREGRRFPIEGRFSLEVETKLKQTHSDINFENEVLKLLFSQILVKVSEMGLNNVKNIQFD